MLSHFLSLHSPLIILLIFCHFSFQYHSFEFNCAQETLADGDPELLDDSEFYQQLLKEFFETVDPSSSGKQFCFG
jgi:hypothetical protein